MATVNLGRIKPVFRGAYSGSTAYVVDDIVTSGNETYICIQAHGAGTQAVTQTAYWTKLAAKGADGSDGTDLTSTLTTQGDILYRDGSGLARLGYGTSGQVLQTGGSGANPSWVNAGGGGQFSFVTRTAITSSVASVAFTNLEANNYHKFVFQSIDSSANGGEDFAARVSTNNGSSFHSADYRFTIWQTYDSGSTNNTGSGGSGTTADKWRFADGFHTSGTDEGLHGEFTLFNVGNGQRPFFYSRTTHKADSNNRARSTNGGGFCENGLTINGIQFFFDSGNITGSSYAFITHYKGVIA